MRIASTKYTEQIDEVAYLTPENKIVVLLLNKSDQILSVNIRLNGKIGSLILAPELLSVCQIEL